MLSIGELLKVKVLKVFFYSEVGFCPSEIQIEWIP